MTCGLTERGHKQNAWKRRMWRVGTSLLKISQTQPRHFVSRPNPEAYRRSSQANDNTRVQYPKDGSS